MSQIRLIIAEPTSLPKEIVKKRKEIAIVLASLINLISDARFGSRTLIYVWC